MKLNDVKKLTPFQRVLYWIEERESVRIKKESGKQRPWTDDTILRENRFCNVRRMDDRVSQWLLNNWYKPYFDHPNALVACVLARHFNNPATLSAITRYVYGASYMPEAIVKTIQRLKETGVTVFNPAYIIRAETGDKTITVVRNVAQPIYDSPPAIDTNSMQETVEALTGCYGLGSFMAGQIAADLRWAFAGTWADRDSWAAMGPGSKRGMNRLLNREVDAPMVQEEFLEHLSQFIAKAKKSLPISITSRLECIDWQNVFCETDKYNRVLFREGRAKQRYDG